MTGNEYQKLAQRTMIDEPGFTIPGKDMMTIWYALGLAGEAGEVANHVKKGILHQHVIKRDMIIKELGDVIWYIAALCENLDIELELIMASNIAKLIQRYPNGYSPIDSRNRSS